MLTGDNIAIAKEITGQVSIGSQNYPHGRFQKVKRYRTSQVD